MGRHLGHERTEDQIRERQQHVEIAIHPHVVNAVMLLDELKQARALDPSDRRLVHEIVEAFVAHVVYRHARDDGDHKRDVRERNSRGVERPRCQRPRCRADRDEDRAAPPCERERLMLLLIRDVERVVEFTKLVMDQRVLGEAVLGEPRTVQPEAVERPLDEAGLDHGDREANQDRD